MADVEYQYRVMSYRYCPGTHWCGRTADENLLVYLAKYKFDHMDM